ncbi:cation diffusion facilitator family transporter [Amycolatopsis sp. NPDC059657]|uniref:cation diffusion facilitator family transporter n=1 Tax=Amycolatopsis sp. NPDC059657 TaxID=3346899 RepID=UPI00367085F1
MEQPKAMPDVRGDAARRALVLQYVTIAYNVVEGIIAIGAGLAAASVALVGFGVDSGVEIVAALLIAIRLRAAIRTGAVDERKEYRALRFVALTFFALGAFILFESVREIVTGAKPEKSLVGIVLTGVSIVTMSFLASAKRRTGLAMNSRLVVADAAETRLCVSLSVTTFLGLVAYALLGWTWLDAVAGLVIALFAVNEGRRAWSGELTCDG